MSRAPFKPIEKCLECGAEFPVPKKPGNRPGLCSQKCKDSARTKIVNASYARRAESVRNKRILRKYGLTPAQWQEMFISQGCKCAICGEQEHGARGWSTDHDHETGKVRGILCHACNVGIGLFYEDVDLLSQAADYIRATTPSRGGVA